MSDSQGTLPEAASLHEPGTYVPVDGSVAVERNGAGRLPAAPPPINSKTGRPIRKYGIPLLLLIITSVTTTAIGARFMQNFLDGLPPVAHESDLWPWPWLMAHPSRFLLGWPFSLSLLSILLAHEFGHYFACRYHGVRVTLPWVLPAPTLSGTAGAVIQIRSHIPNRRALMDIGAYGPLAGYIVALGVVAIGFCKSVAGRPSPAMIQFSEPYTLRALYNVLHVFRPGTFPFETALRHPVLIAGWVGLFVTALNLIPAGQLDGGHIVYALSPKVHRWLTFLFPVVLLACGYFFWLGWILWAVLLLIPAMRHPRVPVGQPLDRKRKLLSIVCLAIFLLTVAVEPFTNSSIRYYLHR